MYNAKMILNTVINDCREYWNNYYETGLISGAVLGFFYGFALWYRFICLRSIKKVSIFRTCMRILLVALLGFYCYLVLGITVLSRTGGAAYIIRPVPFSTWGTDPVSLTFWLENILMMIPFGVLLYILWAPFRKLGWALLAGSLFSLTIECVQFFTGLGKFETDDIINNVSGVLIGVLLCKGIVYIFESPAVH